MQVSVTFLCWWCLKWRPRPRAAAASARQKSAQVLCCLPWVPHPHKDCEFTKLISQQKDDEQPQPALNAGLRAMKSRDATSSQSRGCPWAPAAMLRGNERMTFLLMKCSFAQGTILLLLFIIYALLKVCMMLYSAIQKMTGVQSLRMLHHCRSVARGQLMEPVLPLPRCRGSLVVH